MVHEPHTKPTHSSIPFDSPDLSLNTSPVSLPFSQSHQPHAHLQVIIFIFPLPGMHFLLHLCAVSDEMWGLTWLSFQKIAVVTLFLTLIDSIPLSCSYFLQRTYHFLKLSYFFFVIYLPEWNVRTKKDDSFLCCSPAPEPKTLLALITTYMLMTAKFLSNPYPWAPDLYM